MSFWGNVVGAAVGAGASIWAGDQAADAAEDASRASIGLQREIYNQNREDLAPYRQAGYGALNQIANMYLGGGGSGRSGGGASTMGWVSNGTPFGSQGGKGGGVAADITQTPGYQFRFNQGIQALDRSAAARGRLNSGAQGKALQEFGQGIAAAEYNDNFNRLARIAGLGGESVGTTAQMGSNFASGASNSLANAAAARGSAYQNVGNAINQGAANLLYAGNRYGWF